MAERWAGSDFVAGNLCLDFANTIENRVDPAKHRDRLASPADLLSWLRYSELVRKDRKHGLDRVSRCGPGALNQATLLREAIYRVFSAIAGKGSPGADDVNDILSAFAKGARNLSVMPTDDGVDLSWRIVADDPDSLLAPLAHSATTLLFGADLNKVKQCKGCGWLFLDTSKNGRRRWCDMKTCGNREKVNRHRRAKHHND